MQLDFSSAIDKIEDILNGLIGLLPNFILAGIVLILFYLLAGWVKSSVYKLSKKYGHQVNLGILLGRLSRWLVNLVGLLIALVIVFPDFSPGKLFQVLGLGSVAIGFAFQDILQNFFAGILLLLDQPFRIGDQIVMGSYEGTVESIETRATAIRTYDGRRVVIPNVDLYTGSFTINTAFDKRRLQYEVGIGYGDDIQEAKRVITELLLDMEGILKEPAPDVYVSELASFYVSLRVRCWISPSNQAQLIVVRDKVLVAVAEALTAHGIDMPFPTQQILFHDQTEDIDGNRARQREGWPAQPGETPPLPRYQV